MWENAYLSIKNPKASRALKWALDPSRKLLASLRRQLSASGPGPPLDQILGPHLTQFRYSPLLSAYGNDFFALGFAIFLKVT